MDTHVGGFTLPGESGHEELTLTLAAAWGADVIRDSDGTRLSDEILRSGHGIYSTVCLVREDLEWAKAHSDLLQQNFLMSDPVVATGPETTVDLLSGFSKDQFTVNATDGLEFWQVFDRTTGQEVPRSHWHLDQDARVIISDTVAWHSYTVNFLVLRIWEEISMYNHVTNDWGDRPHLRAVEPRHPAVRAHLLRWLDEWCTAHPDTTVVRFTSLFYNFAWFWGDDPALPHRYADWGSYDFTVNPAALREFAGATGLTITSEDFVNAGRYTSSHNPPSAVYRAWMDFIGDFVVELGRECVDIVHSHGKQAYVFYDDSWIGLEPHSPRFQQFGFDGLIKAVFSAYEARLCSGVEVPTHELRLHPYLFPVDLQGKPTFAAGGDPTTDARRYWTTVRRALLRAPIERIGLGGYLSLVAPFPDFQDYIATVANEHRLLLSLHRAGGPDAAALRVGVLTSWGSLRTWTCSGHLHENPDLILNHVLESLAGLNVDVRFLCPEDLLRSPDGADAGLDGIDVLVNAGLAGSAWIAGDAWTSPAVVESVTRFVAEGGGLVGIGQPGAARHSTQFFQLAQVLGVDQDSGDRGCLVRRSFTVDTTHSLARPSDDDLPLRAGVFLTRGDVHVLGAVGTTPTAALTPTATATAFGRGRAAYLSGHRHTPRSCRQLEDTLLWVAGRSRSGYWSDDPSVDVAYFPAPGVLVAANSAQQPVDTVIRSAAAAVPVSLSAGAMLVHTID